MDVPGKKGDDCVFGEKDSAGITVEKGDVDIPSIKGKDGITGTKGEAGISGISTQNSCRLWLKTRIN